MNHHLEVSTAIYFLICLRETIVWPLAINIFQPKKAVLMTANLSSQQQKLWELGFWNASFALYSKNQIVLEQLTLWNSFLHACSIMQMIKIQPSNKFSVGFHTDHSALGQANAVQWGISLLWGAHHVVTSSSCVCWHLFLCEDSLVRLG